jgi:hypothetical protein
MALVRLSRLQDLVALSQMAQWLGQMRNAPPGTNPMAAAGRAQPIESAKKKPVILPPETTASPAGAETAPTGPVALGPETLAVLWGQILASLGGMLGSELHKANLPAISGPNALVLSFPPAYNRAKEFCQAPERLARIEDAARKVIGRPCSIRVQGETAPAPRAERGTLAGPESEAVNAPKAARPRRSAKEEAEKLPLVKRAVEVLGATIQRVDDNFGSPVDSEGEGKNGVEGPEGPQQEP